MPFENEQLTPLPLAGVADYHCHCDYSVDAQGTVDEFCEAALQRGLAEVCFVTHYNTNPNVQSGDCFIRIKGERKPVSPDNLEPYIEDVQRAHEKFYPLGLSVKLGIEISWWPGCAESTAKLKDRFQFDHVLCGVHEVDNLSICSSKFGEQFKDYSPDELVKKYFQQTIQAAHTGLFNAIAHFGRYLRYGLLHYGDAISTVHEPYLEELFDALKETETALEINTSSIRHGLHEYYPGMAIVNAARKAGVALPFLGSDAHRPEQIGLDFEAAVALVPDAIVPCDD